MSGINTPKWFFQMFWGMSGSLLAKNGAASRISTPHLDVNVNAITHFHAAKLPRISCLLHTFFYLKNYTLLDCRSFAKFMTPLMCYPNKKLENISFYAGLTFSGIFLLHIDVVSLHALKHKAMWATGEHLCTPSVLQSHFPSLGQTTLKAQCWLLFSLLLVTYVSPRRKVLLNSQNKSRFMFGGLQSTISNLEDLSKNY